MKKIYSFLFATFALAIGSYANPGDTTWVQANNVNLSNYASNYDTAVSFPNGTVSYRKILMICTIGEYACPAGSQYCHQWDYDIENYIMTTGGDTLELSRLITPFANTGWSRFPATWQQPYIFDVTDFYPYLKNNATIRLFFSGYSGGFTANYKFAFIEGVPDRNVVSISSVYKQSSDYGNAADPINNHLPAISLTAPTGTISAEMRAIITGHNSDNNQCCEFDQHSMNVMQNNTSIYTQSIWRDNCGTNNLYPQGGTWTYERSNWCPGALVMPYKFKLQNITAGTTFNTNLKFASYTGTAGANGFGLYKISANVVYYKGINKTLDASLDDILAPTQFPDHFRQNPSNDQPTITIHNSGSTAISSVMLEYGVIDSATQQYTWNGSLAPLADTTITLPVLAALTNLAKSSSTGTHQFIARILNVNGQTDNDQTNDTLKSTFVAAPVWPGDIVINFRTGNMKTNGATGTTGAYLGSWTITDMNNNIIHSESAAQVLQTYNDTIALPAAGYYKLTLNSTQCYGFHWWPLDDPQYGITPGALIVKNLGGSNIPMNSYTYAGSNLSDYGQHDDFGCQYVQYFYATTPGSWVTAINDVSNLYSLSVYPNPASNTINIEITGIADLKMAHIALVNVLGQTVYNADSRQQKITINTESLANGVYTITYDNGSGKRTEKIVISK